MPRSTRVSGSGDARMPRRGSLQDMVRRLRRRPLGLAGLLGAGLFLGAAALGPWVAPADPFALGSSALMPPGRGHWLGTDDLGRDVLSGVLYGARVSLVVGLCAAAGSALIGVTVGAAAGYWRGRLAGVLMGLTGRVLVGAAVLHVLGRAASS